MTNPLLNTSGSAFQERLFLIYLLFSNYFPIESRNILSITSFPSISLSPFLIPVLILLFKHIYRNQFSVFPFHNLNIPLIWITNYSFKKKNFKILLQFTYSDMKFITSYSRIYGASNSNFCFLFSSMSYSSVFFYYLVYYNISCEYIYCSANFEITFTMSLTLLKSI